MSKKKSTKNDWTKQDDKLVHEINKRRLDRVRSLVAKDHLSPTKINPRTGSTALHNAAFENDLAVLKILIDCKEVDINSRDLHGRTVLHRAAAGGVFAIERLLKCQPPLDVSAVDHTGLTVLHHACIGNHLDCVKLLLEHHAPVFVKDKNGRSALSYAAERGQASICRLLLQHGADIDDKDNFNRTSLMMAAEAGHAAVCDYLVRQGADTFITNSRGWDALYIAAKGNKTEVVKILERATRDSPSDNADKRSPGFDTHTHKTGENEYEEMPNADEVAVMVLRAAAELEQAQVAAEAASSSSTSTAAAAAAGDGCSGKASNTSIRSRERLPTPNDDVESVHMYHVLGETLDDEILRNKIAKFEKITDGASISLSMTDGDSMAGMMEAEDQHRPAASASQEDGERATNTDKSHRISTSSEPSLTLRQVDITDQDVELLPQIINELETEKAAMSCELENIRMEKKDLELSRLELEKKYSLVVNSHQWLLQELCQILKLIESFRHELAASTSGTSMSAGAENDGDEQQHDLKRNVADDVVDTGLGQIERLIGALVHLDHDVHYIEDVDVYGCYEADVDKLVSLSKRLQRSNQTLQYELRQSVHENMTLHRQVEQLEKIADAACRLQEESDTLRTEYDQLVNDVTNFKDHVAKISMTDRESIEFIDLAVLFEKSVEDNEQLKRAVDELLFKVDELESAIEVDRRSATETDEKGGLAARYRQFSIQLDALQQENLSKDDENKRLADSAGELTKKIVTLESELKNLHSSTADMEATLMEAVDENKRLVTAKQQLLETLSQLQTSVNSSTGGMEAVIKELVARNSELLRTNEELGFQISSLEKIQQKNAAAEDLSNELESLRSAKRSLEDQVNEMNEAISRQSQMILNLDEELRVQRGNDVRNLVHQSATNLTSDQQVLQQTQAPWVSSSNRTSVDKTLPDGNIELELNIEKLRKLGETKVELEKQLQSAQSQVEQLVISIRQYEEDVRDKNIEIEQLRGEIIEHKKQTQSEKEYYQRKLDGLHREHSTQYQKLSEQNESLKNELIASSRQRETSSTVATCRTALDDEGLLERRQQPVREQIAMSGVTVSQIVKLFAEGGINDRQEKDEEKRSNSVISGTDSGERDAVDGIDQESDDVEWCEQKLLSDLAKAVDASQMLLNENRRLRQEIDKLTKSMKPTEAEDDTDTADTAVIHQAEMENTHLKKYIEELLSEISTLKKTVEQQGISLENSGRILSANALAQNTGLSGLDLHRLGHHDKVNQESKSDSAAELCITQDENDHNSIVRPRSRNDSNINSIGEEDKRHKDDDGDVLSMAEQTVTQDSIELQISKKTPESSVGNPNVIQGQVGTQTEDAKRELVLEVLDENQRLRDDIERLSAELNSTIKELDAKQAIIQGLESFLTKNRESMEKRELATKIAQDFVIRCESIADKAGKVLSANRLSPASSGATFVPPRGNFVETGECIAIEQLQQLLETFEKIVQERNDLLEKVALLRETSMKQEVASEQTMKNLRVRIEELEQELSQRRSKMGTSAANNNHDDEKEHFHKTDSVDSSRKLVREEDSIDSSRHANDVIAALTSENEAMRRLLESRAPQLAPDFEERLMAEVESLSSECKRLRRQLANGSKIEEGRAALETDREKTIIELRAQGDRLREENRQLRQQRHAMPSDQSSTTVSSTVHSAVDKSDDSENHTQKIGGDRKQQNERVNDGAESDSSSAISSDSEGRRVVRRVSISGIIVPLEPDQPSPDRRQSTPSTTVGSIVDSDRRRRHLIGREPSDVDVVQLRRRCRHLENENEALRNKMATAWKVSVQHAVSRNVGVQTTDVVDASTDGTRRLSACDDDLYLTYCNVTSVPRSATPSTVSGHNLDTDQLVVEIRRLTRMLAHYTPDTASLLGAPLEKGQATDERLSARCNDLARVISRLELISAHDALVLLKNSFSAPRVQFTLRSAPCVGHPHLQSFDNLLHTAASKICNVTLSDDQWQQEAEKNKQDMIRTYRRHLLESVQGRIDPLVKEALLQIIQSRHGEKLVSA